MLIEDTISRALQKGSQRTHGFEALVWSTTGQYLDASACHMVKLADGAGDTKPVGRPRIAAGEPPPYANL